MVVHSLLRAVGVLCNTHGQPDQRHGTPHNKGQGQCPQLPPVLDSCVTLTGPWELQPGYCPSLSGWKHQRPLYTMPWEMGRFWIHAQSLWYTAWPIDSAAEAWHFLQEFQFSLPRTVPGPHHRESPNTSSLNRRQRKREASDMTGRGQPDLTQKFQGFISHPHSIDKGCRIQADFREMGESSLGRGDC